MTRQARGFTTPHLPKKWDCVHCGKLDKDEVTEESYGDQSQVYCNRCGFRSVSRIRPKIQLPEPARPKRFCFFIKPQWGYDSRVGFSEKYTRFEEICLAIRIGYFKEAIRLLIGKRSSYIWEGIEDNPMPF